MTTSYKELIKQRDALEQAIAQARENELSEAVRQVRQLVSEFGLTVHDVFPSGRGASKQKSSTGSKVAPKYRDPVSGQTWTGRGKAPKWIDGKERSPYLIG
ncbi:H-NS histone family protein [Limnohabitans sp. 103DPR2]|uniref:H-NS histone family protein n=1 Tax=Limnohabitans sp. 103DPR2 TaxID=1678129 RepID=UPI0007069782|nr:H-NS histone family protein [Limnohabitans sp. 103DPR2]ALK92746.1 H-NS histone family protein [Limnohabitans sp. 103DPR2]